MRNLKIFFLILILIPIFMPILSVHAAEGDYTVLAPLPYTTDCGSNPTGANCQTTLEKYLPGLFKLLIGLAAVWAVLMIVYGGLQYMSTDAVMKKSEGKQRITNAIYGLVLVIAAATVLNTINPKLLELNLNIEKVTTTQTGVYGTLTTLGGEDSAGTGRTLPWYSLSEADVAKDKEMRNDLYKYDVIVNAGPCTTTGQTSGCTNLVGMPAASYQGVKDLAKNCDCVVEITGGTEGGHASHGPNKPQLDLGFDPGGLDAFIKNSKNWAAQPSTQFGYPAYTVKVSDQLNATFVQEGNHWHVMFGK